MDGLDFVTAPTLEKSASARVDVACFVGLVARRPEGKPPPAELAAAPLTQEALRLRRVLPAWVVSWLQQQQRLRFTRDGVNQEILAPEFRLAAERLRQLEDIPVPLESWDAFDELFDWDARVVESPNASRRAGTRLGAAVKEFFERGGRFAYVVRVGDPPAVLETRAVRLEMLRRLIPDVTFRLGDQGTLFDAATRSAWAESLRPMTSADPGSWRGIGHLLGLPDVSFMVLPDLPDLFAADIARFIPAPPARRRERFLENSERSLENEVVGLRHLPAPRCDEDGFRQWSAIVQVIGEFLRSPANGVREAQFIGAVPLPLTTRDQGFMSTQTTPADRLNAAHSRVQAANRAQWEAAGSVQSAFVQLIYPWLRLPHSNRLPDGLTSPDGTWAGLLAANALTEGTWRSLQRWELPGVLTVEPVIDPSLQQRKLPWRTDTRVAERTADRTLRERISLIGPTGGGMRVLSDVTTDNDETYRQAPVSRLMAALLRAARSVGESFVFRGNGPRLWRQLQQSLEALLGELWAEGALDGADVREAFSVRCDATTMSQADRDAGRLIAEIVFRPAANLERIVVVLAMEDGGQVSLVGVRPETQRREAA